MVPDIPPEEIAPLMRFVAEKSKNVTSPMNVTELCRQFQRETGSLVLVISLAQGIKLHRDRIHEMVEFSTDTKVKMIFALSASIDTGFLNELKKVAEVKVDDQRRILEYKQKDGGLHLSGKHSGVSTKNEELLDKNLNQFLARKSKTNSTPTADIYLMREFKEKTGYTGSEGALEESYQRVKRKIYQAPGKKFHADRWQNVCEKVNKDESDEDKKQESQRLKEFEGRYGLSSQKDFEEKRKNLVKFLIERTKDAKYPMSIPSLAADFKTEFKNSDSLRVTEDRILSFRTRIHEINQFEMSTKVKMILALSASVDPKFLKEIQKDAFVELDEMKRIKTYIAHDLSLELEGDHSFSANIQGGKVNALSESTEVKNSESISLTQNLASIQKGRTIKKSFYSDLWENICQKVNNDESEEDERDDSNWQKTYEKKQINLVRFLIEKTKNATSPLSLYQLAKDYKTEFKCSDNVGTTEARIRNFRQRIHTMNQSDTQTKVKLAFALSTSIDADFLKELQKDAIVELDEKKRIKKYNANDSSLNLEGDHSVSAKRRSGNAERKKKASVLNDLSHPEDSEFDISQSPAAVSKGRKRARQILNEDEEESLKLEDDWSIDFDADDFDYDSSKYELDMEHIPIDKKPESLMEVKAEVPSTSTVGNHYEENFFYYDILNYVDDMEHIPVEKKPESLIEVKTEVPDGPSTSNLEYHYEEHFEHFLIEPKPEIIQ